MFNRFKGLVALFSVLCISIITGASAYFYFGGEAEDPIDKTIANSTSSSVDNGITSDNILENYEFGVDKNLNEEYTYIFFPSTLYAELYTETQNPEDGSTETQNPEDFFGYNEVILNDSGDPAMSADNQPQYNIVKKGNTTYYKYMVDNLNDLPGYYLSSSFGLTDSSKDYYPNTLTLNSNLSEGANRYYTFEPGTFTDPYIINNPNLSDYVSGENNPNNYNQVWRYVYERPILGDITYNYYFYNYELNEGEAITEAPGVTWNGAWGERNPNQDPKTAKVHQIIDFSKKNEVLSPTVDENDAFDINLDNEANDKYNKLFDAFLKNVDESFLREKHITFNSESKGYLKNMYGRVQYRNDRFGARTAFYDWDDDKNVDSYDESKHLGSRYLPIKITVNGNLTPDDMSKILPTLTCSSYDKYWYFDYTSNVWTYATSPNDKFYSSAVEGITAKDVTNIFDVMQHPSKYADTSGVIRLFPVFSNGKGYDKSVVAEGGADGIRAVFDYKSTNSSIDNNFLAKQTKFSYSSKTYTGLYDSNNVNYAVLKNVELVKERYNSIKIEITTTDYSAHWGSEWTEVYEFRAKALDSFIDIYGGGLYTFYLFIGNRATNYDWGSSTPFADIKGYNFLKYITDVEDSEDNELRNKYLMPFYQHPGSDKITTSGNDGFMFVQGDRVSGQNRPIALAVEKITNLRLVTDIPIIENSDGKPSGNQDWTQIDSSVQAGLINAQNFILADDIYEIDYTQYNNENLNGENLSGTTVDSSNPYIYLIQNADFRFVNNLYFQIRFSNQYIKDGMTVKTDYAEVSNQDETPKYLAYKIDQENIIKFKFQDSNDPDDNDVFIDNTNPISGDLNGQTVERQGFKLRDYNARGVYDILLVSTNDAASNQQRFNMYINRHTNSFIKLFKGDPGTFEFDVDLGETIEKDIFVSHKLPSEASEDEQYQVRSTGSKLLWNGQTFLGEYLQTSTTGTGYTEEVADAAESTILDAIKKELGVEPGRDKIYPIYDAVTKKQIAYYNSGVGRLFTSDGSTADNSLSLNLFTIMKNYVLYIGNPVYQVA